MSIEATVCFYGVIHDVVDQRKVEVHLSEGATVKDLLKSLGEKYGERFRRKVLSTEGKLQKSVKVVVGGENIDQDQLECKLGGEDTLQVQVLIIPAVFGG